MSHAAAHTQHQHTPEEMQALSQAVSLTVLEIDANTPKLIPAFLLANMMSPDLWSWRDQRSAFDPEGNLLSPRRRLNELQRFMHRYTFLNIPGEPAGDPWGLITFDEEGDRLGKEFVEDIRGEYHRTFLQLKAEDPDSQFGSILDQPFYAMGQFPRLKNESFEIMNAFERIPALEGKRAGKCIGLTMLWAAAACVWGRFSPKQISIVGNRAHMFAFIDEDEGHLLNNTKWFNVTRIANKSELSEFVRHVTSSTETSFVYNVGTGLCHCAAGYTTLPADVSNVISQKLSDFVAKPIHNDPCPVEYSDPDFRIPNPLAFRDVQEYSSHIHQFAECKPGSVFEYAVYAFRSLAVQHPEIYAIAAMRDPKTAELGEKVADLQGALEIVASIREGRSLFGEGRIAMPDETLLFNTGTAADRALLLYTLLQHSPLADPDSMIVLTDDGGYVSHCGVWLDAVSLEECSKPAEASHRFNSRSSTTTCPTA